MKTNYNKLSNYILKDEKGNVVGKFRLFYTAEQARIRLKRDLNFDLKIYNTVTKKTYELTQKNKQSGKQSNQFHPFPEQSKISIQVPQGLKKDWLDETIYQTNKEVIPEVALKEKDVSKDVSKETSKEILASSHNPTSHNPVKRNLKAGYKFLKGIMEKKK